MAVCLHTTTPPKQQPQTQRINGDSQNDGDFACDWATFSFDAAQDDQVREQPHTALVLLVLNTVQTTTVTPNIHTLAMGSTVTMTEHIQCAEIKTVINSIQQIINTLAWVQL